MLAIGRLAVGDEVLLTACPIVAPSWRAICFSVLCLCLSLCLSLSLSLSVSVSLSLSLSLSREGGREVPAHECACAHIAIK